MAAGEDNVLFKLRNREIQGLFKHHRKSLTQRIFKKIPGRLCYQLPSLVPPIVLEEGYVFLGFTKCGQFVVSYTCHLDTNEHLACPIYIYRLQWWWFVPGQPLRMVSDVRLFGEEDIVQDLYILFCEWPEDHTQVLIFGHSVYSRDQESRQSYLTITAVPSLSPCAACKELNSGPETSENSNSEKTLCLKHGFCVHTKYVLTPPFPVFCPRVQLKFDGSIIINTGDSIIALSVQLSTRKKCDSQGQKADTGLRETRQNSADDKHREKSENGAISGSNNTCNVQDSLVHLNTHARVEVTEKSLQLSLSRCSDSEDQKENESVHSPEVRLDKCKSPKSPPEVKFEKIKSPKSPKCVLFPSQKSPTNPLPHDNWFDCLGFGSSSNQNSSSSLRKMHPGCSGINVHPVAKDLYNFDSDDSEDSSSNLRYSISGVGRYSLRSRQVGNTQDLVSHAQNIIIAQASIGSREKMLQNNGKFSPLHSSQALNFDIGRPSLTVDVCIHPRALASSQRSFFSPSNSENGSSCGNSPVVESPMFVSNEPKTITFSCRKYSFKEEEPESESPLGSEDDLAYGGVLPMEARGPHERLLSLQTGSTDNDDGDPKQDKINIKQWTFDVEIYMENAIKKTAEWGHRYVDFINYDLQVLDVCSDRGFVLGQVYTLVHAREDISQIKKARRSRLLVKLYQTSFTFEWNIGTDNYETLHIDSLIEIDERDARKKDWKPGFKECTILRRQTCVPQSVFKTVHVLSNESVFKGRSLQTLLSVQHYTAILL